MDVHRLSRLGLTGLVVSVLAHASACADDGGSEAGTSAPTTTLTQTETGNASAETQPGDGDGDGAPTGDGDGDGATGDGDGTPGDGDGAPGDGDGDGDGGTKFDMAALPDAGGVGCQGMGGADVEFSYIWVANSVEGTLSKINTQTLQEEGRYITRPDHAGRPSRTSVNLSGDVAVANRDGGVTKFVARIEDCVDQNGMPGIQTSMGAMDVIAWDLEECRAWHTPFMGANIATRPVAWTSGTFNMGSCTWDDQKLWTQSVLLNTPGSMQIHRLDGATGAVEDTIPAPNVNIGAWGAYGGAVDGDNNFWFSTHGSATPPTLSRVDAITLVLDTWPVPNGVSPYGMTFDSKGHAWVAGYAGGTARFSPDSETWDVVANITGLGVQADDQGRVWVGTYSGMGPGVAAIDVDTLQVLDWISMPNAGVTKGVSIDFFGYVWVVNMANSAYRVDPDTHMIDSYDGLNGAYTYSDMTGAGLKSVAFPAG